MLQFRATRSTSHERIGLALTAIAALSFALAGTGCATVPREAPLTPQQRQLNLDSFEYAWTTVNKTYWDPEFGGLDWQAVHDELRPKLEQTSTTSEARAVMTDMISRLGVSHFAILPAEIYEDVDQPGSWDGETGIDARIVDGHALVTTIAEESPAVRAGVRPGWEITHIGKTDIAAKVQKLLAELEDNSLRPAHLASAVKSRLEGRVGDTVSMRFLDGGNHEVALDLTLAEKRGRKVQFGNLPCVHVYAESRKLDGNIGYFAFNAFIAPTYVMQAYNDALRSFLDADGVIIDVRGNGGGMGEIAVGMIGWLVTESRDAGTLYLRDHELKLIIQPRATNYSGPVAVLTDGLSGSAAEVFAGTLQELGRAHIVGSRTAGVVLGARLERLPNGDGFLYAAMNYVAKSGTVFEGVGVIPDIEAPPTRTSLLEGKDAALDAAVAWIRSQQ